MKAQHPYGPGDITEFSPSLGGEIIHFAAFYEYLFIVVSVIA